MDAIERIEVAIRTQLSNVMCEQKNDPFWYLDEQNFTTCYQHKRLLAKIEKQLLDENKRLKRDEDNIDKRSITQNEKDALKKKVQKENFLRHYLSKYDSPQLPPSWMMIEMLTWGDLSHLYDGLESNTIKKIIAKNLGIHAEVLSSWLKTFNDIRNLCAHHNRLWNREFGRSIKIPTSNSTRWLENGIVISHPSIRYEKRLYIVLVAMQTLLYTISPQSTWAKRLNKLIQQYNATPKANMGMPGLWYQDLFWQEALK